MIGSFIRLFALSVTFALGCTAIGLSSAIVGLWLLGLAQEGGPSLQASFQAILANPR